MSWIFYCNFIGLFLLFANTSLSKPVFFLFKDKTETMVFEDGQLVKQMIEKLTEDTSFVLTDKVILTFVIISIIYRCFC